MATFTQLGSGNWRVQVRRKNRYVAETFRRRKDGEEWALEMERNIDRNGSSKPRVVRDVRTFGDLIDLHDEDMRDVGKPPRRSKAAVMASLKAELGSVKLPALNRERLVEFGRKRAKQGAGPATLAIDLSFIRTVMTHAAAGVIPPAIFERRLAICRFTESRRVLSRNTDPEFAVMSFPTSSPSRRDLISPTMNLHAMES